MSRLVILVVLVAGLAVPGLVWAQAAAPRPRPAPAPAPAAAPKPKAADPLARPAGDDKNAPVTVDADQLENMQKEGLIVFTGNVVANQNSSVHYADRMEVYLDAKGENIVRLVSTGNVRIITKDCRMGTARRAEYYDAEQRVVLIGDARVWREDNVVTGERITMFLAEDRSIVEGGKQARVKAVFYPKSEQPASTPTQTQKAEGRPVVAGVPCG